MWPFLQFDFHSLALVYCSLADRQSFIRITTAGLWKTSPFFKWLCAVCCPELLWSAWKGSPPVYSLLIGVLLTHSSVPFQTFACVPPNAAQHAEHHLPPAFLDFRPLMLTITALCRLRNESWLWSLLLIGRLRDIPLCGGSRFMILNRLSHKLWLPVMWPRAAASRFTEIGYLCGTDLFPAWARSSNTPISYILVYFGCSSWG